jgi:hypothetical protein
MKAVFFAVFKLNDLLLVLEPRGRDAARQVRNGVETNFAVASSDLNSVSAQVG